MAFLVSHLKFIFFLSDDLDVSMDDDFSPEPPCSLTIEDSCAHFSMYMRTRAECESL